MSSQIGKAGGVHGRFVGGSAVRGCPGRPGGAPVLHRGCLQGRHRRPARHQPLPGCPAARLRPRRGDGTHRDRPARRQPGRGPVSGTVLGIRAQARVRVQLPRRGRGGAAAPAGRSRGPGADGPHHARRRPRHVLVAHAERARGLAHPAPAVPDRPAHRGGAAPRRPGPARPGPRRGPGGRRPGPRLLRPHDPGRRADGRGDPPPGRHRRCLRPAALGYRRGGGPGRLGARAVDHL